MSQNDLTQRAFSAGEISVAAGARGDSERYASALRLCENMIVMMEGGVTSRPGTRYIGALVDETKRARLIPFSFNTTQNYILVFEDSLMRVIMDGAYVIDSTSPPNIYEMAHTYTEAEIPYLTFTQDADVMTITCVGHPPATLSRLDHDDWTLVDKAFNSQVSPPSSGSISTTLVTGGSGEVSRRRFVVTTVDESGEESLASSIHDAGGGASVYINSIYALTWGAVTGASYYRVYKELYYNGQFGWIGDSNSNGSGIRDIHITPDFSIGPPTENLPFDSTDNYPQTCGYFQQRLLFANTNNEPQTLWGTRIGEYSSLRYSTPLNDDDSIEITLKTTKVAEIRHILSLDALILLTSGSEWVLGANGALTPTSSGGSPYSHYGASWCRPAIVGDTIVYVQEKGNRVREFTYSMTNDRYASSDLTILARHLFVNQDDNTTPYTIEELAYADEPYSIVWAVRSDGVLLGLTYKKEYQMWAWHHHDTQGEFESVATIAEGQRDVPYFIVKRTINGNTHRYVEYMEEKLEGDVVDCFCVDSGLTYTGAAATTITGLDHLIGEDVVALADGVPITTGLTVNGSGEITLATAASVVHVGLSFTPAIETLEIDPAQESKKNDARSVSEVQVQVERSRGGRIAIIKDDGSIGDYTELVGSIVDEGVDDAPLRTYKLKQQTHSEWNYNGGVRVEQHLPLPLTILSVTAEVN